MKKLVLLATLCLPLQASADHMDVIQMKLLEGCDLQKLLAIANDFNTQWGADNGYQAEIVVPIQSQDLVSMFWVGRSASAAAYGKAWDTWRDALRNPDSVPAKLNARFNKCTVNETRAGYDVY